MTNKLSDYIYQKMIDEPRNYQWRIVVDSHKAALEIYVAISLEVAPNQYVQDINAQVNAEGEIYFEEVVCFYDELNKKIIKDNYLHAVPLNPVEGIEAGYVDAFLKQLNIAISTARSQLRLFLEDDEEKEFSLKWNEENMENTVKTMMRTQNYSRDRLTFSIKEEASLVDQLKEEQYDGVERI